MVEKEIVYGFFCRHCGASLADRQHRRDRHCRLCGHEKATLAFRCICGQSRLGGGDTRPHAECRRLLQLENDDPILQCSLCISDFIQSVANLMRQIQAADKIGSSSSQTSRPRRRFSVPLNKKDAMTDLLAIRQSSAPERVEEQGISAAVQPNIIADQDIALLVEILSRTRYEERMEQLGLAEEQYRQIHVEAASYTRGRSAAVRAAQHQCAIRSSAHVLKPPYTSWLFTNEVDALMEILVKPLYTVQVLKCQENIESVVNCICSEKRLEASLPIVCPVIVNQNHFVLVIRSVEDDRVAFVDSKSSGSGAALRSLRKALRHSSSSSSSSKNSKKLEVIPHYLGLQNDQFSCGHWVVQLARLAAVVGLPVSKWPGNIVSLKAKWADVVRDHHDILAAHRVASFKPKKR